MKQTTVNKWDQRYKNAESAGDACWVLQQQQHLLPADGRALDLACGLGANALLLAKQGLDTHAWDNSATAINKLQGFAQQQQLDVSGLVRDVESQPPEPHSFDVIVVSQFLHRALCPALIAALKPGGLLFYQTFSAAKVSAGGPSSARFLLNNNELLQLFNGLDVRFYREDSLCGADLTEGLRDLSYFVGQQPNTVLK